MVSQFYSFADRSHLLIGRDISDRLVLPGAHVEVGVGKVALEADSWMEDGQEHRGQDDHDTLQNHEGGLVVGQLPIEALAELGHSEDGSDEDEECGKCESCMETCQRRVSAAAHAIRLPRRKILKNLVSLRAECRGFQFP